MDWFLHHCQEPRCQGIVLVKMVGKVWVYKGLKREVDERNRDGRGGRVASVRM